MRAYVGTSGWTNLGLKLESLPYRAVEINGSFYTQIATTTYARWRATVPRDFGFALKGHRFVTHYKRLRDCADSVIRLRDQASGLGDKLRAVVWQLPDRVACDLARLDDFLHALGAWPTRHALELRHRSWFTDAVATRLADARVAACISDAPDFPMWRIVTTDLVYVRLHGHTRKYASRYSPASLQRWADDVLRWLDEGREVHVYFDNDAEGHAVGNALSLQQLLDGSRPRARRAEAR